MTRWLVFLLMEGGIGAVLFGFAGRLDLPWFGAVLTTHAVLVGILLHSIDPDLLRERLKPGPGGRDTNLRWLASPFYFAHLAIAGLDVGRFDWSGHVSLLVHAVGLAGYILGMALGVRAVTVNRFFSPVVRIQRDRGHRVIDTGPYRFIRHPGYAGGALASLCGGLALGSWWSLLPMIPVGLLTVRRTLIEDRVLRTELEGYDEYAQRVRYRLIPGVW
jgi:protein-S-isoprenylcysteine O-methyltransferase Ste14